MRKEDLPPEVLARRAAQSKLSMEMSGAVAYSELPALVEEGWNHRRASFPAIHVMHDWSRRRVLLQ